MSHFDPLPAQFPPAMPAPGHPDVSDARRLDPGTPTSSLLAVVLAIVMAAAVIGWQNSPTEWRDKIVGAPAPVAQTTRAMPSVSPVSLLGRAYVRIGKFYEAMGASSAASSGSDVGTMSQQVIDDSVTTPEERIAAAITAAELLDSDAALERLDLARESADKLKPRNPDDAQEIEAVQRRAEAIHRDADDLTAIYEGDELDADSRDRLTERYPYYGELALTNGMDDSSPERADLVGRGGVIMLFMFAMLALVGSAFLAGSIILVFVVIKLSSTRLRFAFRPPAPGGSVFLETYAVFVLGFLTYAMLTTALQVNELVSLAIQWTLLLVPFWPLVRGMKGSEYRRAIGLHTGRGFLREIGAGFTAYIAAIPVFLFGIGLTVVLMFANELIRMSLGAGEPEPPQNPVFDIIEQASPGLLVLIFLLACVWAPLTEELIFRGALYRHLRGRLRWGWAALVTALLFAFMHSYGPLMVSPLIALGFMFAAMREWRGSIIPSMTAHFLHNFTILCIAATSIYLIF